MMKNKWKKIGLWLLLLSLLLSDNIYCTAAQAVTVNEAEEEEEPYDSISSLEIEEYTTSAVTLSWFSDGNNDGFFVYRKSKYDDDFKKLGEVENVPDDIHYFKDSSFVPGIKFTYKVVAYRTAEDGTVTEGQYSSTSIQVEIPETVISKLSRSGSKVTLQWKKASGVSGYEIYRKTGSGSFKKVKTISSANTVKWVSDSASATKTNKYKVRSFVRYSGNYLYSSFSAVKTIYSDTVQKVVNRFKQLQKKYPSGKYWNHVNRANYNSTTVTNQPCLHISRNDISTCNHYKCPNGILGFQCYGFAWKMSDLIYGKTAKIKTFKSFDKSKMGDVIRYSGHSVIITEKHKNYVVVGECNYGDTCMILWGRKVYRSELKKASYSRRY